MQIQKSTKKGQGNHFAAVLKRPFYRVFEPAAAGNCHSDYRDAFYVVIPNDLREFVPAISFVKLGIVERGHLVPDKPVVKIAISISLLLLSLLLSMITGFILVHVFICLSEQICYSVICFFSRYRIPSADGK